MVVVPLKEYARHLPEAPCHTASLMTPPSPLADSLKAMTVFFYRCLIVILVSSFRYSVQKNKVVGNLRIVAHTNGLFVEASVQNVVIFQPSMNQRFERSNKITYILLY